MYVVSYCQIYTFHPSLKLEKIVIYRSFQQTANEMFDLGHFKREHAVFFDTVTYQQLKDAAQNVFNREKSTSLWISVELKFTIDTLKNWLNQTIKPKYYELDSAKKHAWRKKNPVNFETKCSICDFPLEPRVKDGWFDFVVRAEHLFLRNIYEPEELEKMNIKEEQDYKELLYRLIDLCSAFETCLQEIRQFARKYELLCSKV